MPNLIDPNSTIEFGKLKLKDPYSLSSPDNNDVLCAFDATDGELSKTNLKVKDVANLEANIKASINLTAGATQGGINDTYVDAYGNRMVYICIHNSDKAIYEFGVTTNGAWAYNGYTLLYRYV